MPTDDDTDSDDDDGADQGSTGVREMRKRIKALEAERDGLRQAADRNPALERELAFAKAGIAADSPMAPYFVKGYDGELTPEQIRAAAQSAGVPLLGAQPAGATPPAASDRRAEVETHRSMDATGPGDATGGDNTDAYLKALAEAGYDQTKILDVVEKFGLPTSRTRPD